MRKRNQKNNLISVDSIHPTFSNANITSQKYYANGVNDDYPNIVDNAIDESVTTSAAIVLLQKYIYGKGILGDNTIQINQKQKLNDFVRHVVYSYTRHKGVFIHLSYNLNMKIVEAKVLNYADCRVGKQDDNGYSGKYYFKKDKKYISYDAFNSNPAVIKAQIEEAGSIENYKGQIYFYNQDYTIYPKSLIHSVIKDAESEIQASKYKNTSLTRGFFGRFILISPPMGITEDMYTDNVDADEGTIQRMIDEKNNNFKETIKKFIGSENANGVLCLQAQFEGDDLEKQFVFKKLDTEINDKVFQHTESSVKENIATATNVPSILINKNDTSIFGNSGELLTQAKITINQHTADDREEINNILNTIVPLMEVGERMAMLKITPLL